MAIEKINCEIMMHQDQFDNMNITNTRVMFGGLAVLYESVAASDEKGDNCFRENSVFQFIKKPVAYSKFFG